MVMLRNHIPQMDIKTDICNCLGRFLLVSRWWVPNCVAQKSQHRSKLWDWLPDSPPASVLLQPPHGPKYLYKCSISVSATSVPAWESRCLTLKVLWLNLNIYYEFGTFGPCQSPSKPKYIMYGFLDLHG